MTRKTMDICQECYEVFEPDQYFPDATRYGECAVCGWTGLVIRYPAVEMLNGSDCACCGMAHFRAADGHCFYCDGRKVCCRN